MANRPALELGSNENVHTPMLPVCSVRLGACGSRRSRSIDAPWHSMVEGVSARMDAETFGKNPFHVPRDPFTSSAGSLSSPRPHVARS